MESACKICMKYFSLAFGIFAKGSFQCSLANATVRLFHCDILSQYRYEVSSVFFFMTTTIDDTHSVGLVTDAITSLLASFINMRSSSDSALSCISIGIHLRRRTVLACGSSSFIWYSTDSFPRCLSKRCCPKILFSLNLKFGTLGDGLAVTSCTSGTVISRSLRLSWNPMRGLAVLLKMWNFYFCTDPL